MVNKEGKVTDVEVDETLYKQNIMKEVVMVGYGRERDVTHSKDMEALLAEVKRVISMLKPFTPGQRGGKNVAVKMAMPFVFQLG